MLQALKNGRLSADSSLKNNPPKRPRLKKHSKEISRKKQTSKEYDDQYCEYTKFLLDNVEKVKERKESPHIIISRSYRLIEDNSIELIKSNIENESQHERKIFYQVGKIGK